MNEITVAYHDGPPAIGFFGRQWTRGVAQVVTPEEWEGMQARGDFKEFDFVQQTTPANERSLDNQE